jgi:hypothetical protein
MQNINDEDGEENAQDAMRSQPTNLNQEGGVAILHRWLHQTSEGQKDGKVGRQVSIRTGTQHAIPGIVYKKRTYHFLECSFLAPL